MKSLMGIALALLALPAVAQVARPTGYMETPGTVAVANTFQTVLPANPTRNACLLQNTSTATLLVYPGPLASATAAGSYQVGPGGTFSCSSGAGVINPNEINVTSATAGATFVMGRQ